MNKLKFFINKLFPPKYENKDVENAYNEMSKKDNKFIVKATSVGLLIHLLYVCSIVFTNKEKPLYTYINILCVNMPITIFVSARYLIFDPKNYYVRLLCDVIVSFHSIMWATGSLLLSLLCKIGYQIGNLCLNDTDRPISLGLVFYATFGVLLTLLVYRVNKIIMLSIITLFSIYFISIWCYITSNPYILLLPCLSFYLYSFVFASNQEFNERSIFSLVNEYKKESELRKNLQFNEKIINQKNRQFVNYVFHETRVALNTVVLNWQLIEIDINKIDTLIKGNTGDAKNSINIGLESLESILNDVLDLRKMQDGNFVLNIKPFDVNKCINELRISQQNICNAKKINLIVCLDPKINELKHLCLGDKNRLRQVVTNFMSNAVKFTNSGGEIVIRTILQTLKNDIATIYMSVTDNGIGISDMNQKKLFKNFSQVSPISSSKNLNPKGTGLGMAIVASIVNSHCGKYGVISKVNEGSTFWIEIPFNLSVELREQDEKNGTPSYEKNMRTIKVSKHNLHILVIDDDIPTQKIMKKTIEKLGHTCEVVGDGLSALNLLNTKDFNIVLTDVQLPVMDGIQFIQQAREQGYTLPIIILTGTTMNNDDEKGYLRLKANGVLLKPISSLKLQNIINLVIHNKLN